MILSKPTNRQYAPIVALLAVTTIITLLPFFQAGFTTSDDLQYFITAHKSFHEWLIDASIYAKGAGRFYFYITKYFYYIPYLVDDFVYTKAVQYITLVGAYVALSYLIYRIFRNIDLALLTYLLLVFNTQLTPNNHIPIIAYPFYFTFSFILFCTAVVFFIDYCEKKGYWRIILSAILMLLCFCFYETYLLFAFVFGLFVVIIEFRKESRVSKHLVKVTSPYIAVAVLYVVIYFGYRLLLLHNDPEHTFYNGASFDAASFSIQHFFEILCRCTRGAFPTQNFFDYGDTLANNSLLLGGHRRSIFKVLTHAPAITWVNALLQGGLFLWLISRKSVKRVPTRHLTIALVISLFLAFFAHSLVGVAVKYNTDWYQYIKGYVTTFYSHLFLMVAISTFIVLLMKVLKHGTSRKVVQTVLSATIMIASVTMGYCNNLIGREWKKNNDVTRLIDLVAKDDFFDSVDDNTYLYVRDIMQGSVWSYDYNTPNYINLRAHKEMKHALRESDLDALTCDA